MKNEENKRKNKKSIVKIKVIVYNAKRKQKKRMVLE